jgi:hypothetical protein
MPRKQHISLKVKMNQMRICSVDSCQNNRFQVSPYCNKHCKIHYYHGHPTAERITKADYAIDRSQAESIINLNKDHPGIIRAINFIEHAITFPAWFNTPRLLLRLSGVDPIDILIDTCGLYHFSTYSPQIKSDRHRIYAIGNKILRSIPFTESYALHGGHFRDVGNHFNENIGMMWIMVSRAIDEVSRKHEAALIDYNQPLEI